eukprot:jgi/Picsp_1/5854/NSC_03213-R1_gpi mannosyltransferase 1
MRAESGVLLGAFVLRIALIGYGKWQDEMMDVNYTDIDYAVYSDAAGFMNQGLSPYERATYRYTPLLAGILLPNCVMAEYGKVLFSAGDVLAASMMLVELSRRGVKSARVRCLCVSLWLFSPFTATISTRGNGEALVTCMMLGVVGLLERGRIVWAAVLYGISVHWRVYPIIYSLSVLLYLGSRCNRQPTGESGVRRKRGGQTARTIAGLGLKVDQPHAINSTVRRVISWNGVVFGLCSGSVFMALGVVMYWMYGYTFVEETYLYHLTRIDPRHNFSPYFYPAYLDAGKDPSVLVTGDIGTVFSIVSGVLQVYLAFSFGSVDLAGAFMLQTMAFVAFNKVSTAQYFVWYLAWLPITLPMFLRIESRKNVLIRDVLIWSLGLGHWLAWAYLLEFQGHAVYFAVWLASILFLLAHVNLLSNCIVSVRLYYLSKRK